MAMTEKIRIPETLDDTHPIVKGWVRQYEKEERIRRQNVERQIALGKDSWDLHIPWGRHNAMPHLSERDVYRFKMTSALITNLEDRGVKFLSNSMDGKFQLKVEGQFGQIFASKVLWSATTSYYSLNGDRSRQSYGPAFEKAMTA